MPNDPIGVEVAGPTTLPSLKAFGAVGAAQATLLMHKGSDLPPLTLAILVLLVVVVWVILAVTG